MTEARYIGFGEKVAKTAVTERVTYYPMIPFGHGRCVECEAIRPLDDLEYAGLLDDEAVYVCTRGEHPRRAA